MKGLRLGLSLGGGRTHPSALALYLDFKAQSYWEAGTSKALASVTGYSFTDTVDNAPNIDASGFNVLLSETTRLALSSPITSDEDFIAWAAVNYTATANGQAAFDLSSSVVGERVSVYLSSSDRATIVVNDGGVSQYSVSVGAAVSSGRHVMLVRRSAGAWMLASKDPNGTVASGANTTGTFPTITTLRVGALFNGASQADGYVEGMFIRRGTFSDDAVSSILAAA